MHVRPKDYKYSLYLFDLFHLFSFRELNNAEESSVINWQGSSMCAGASCIIRNVECNECLTSSLTGLECVFSMMRITTFPCREYKNLGNLISKPQWINCLLSLQWARTTLDFQSIQHHLGRKLGSSFMLVVATGRVGKHHCEEVAYPD